MGPTKRSGSQKYKGSENQWRNMGVIKDKKMNKISDTKVN
jgi:hypothetical protein